MQAGHQWVYDFSHSKIGFSVRHFGLTEVDGQFRTFTGTARAAKDDFSDLAVELAVDMTSIDTNFAQRDDHLRSADFFDAATYPTMTFRSTRLEPVSAHAYKLHGDLSIKDVTRPVVLDLAFTGLVPRDPFGNTKAGFHVSGQINRKEWGITWNAALDHGGVAVSETVKLSCPIQLLKVA